MTVQDVQTGEKEVCSYDRLVVAVGASPAILPIEGKELAGVFKMRTPDDAEGIRTYAEQNNVKKAVVIGAGFIGLEAAENLQAKGIQVTVIDFADQILPNIFDPEMALYAKRHLIRQGIRVLTGTKAEQIYERGTQGRVAGIKTSAGNLPCEMIIMAAGIRPNTEFLNDSGIEMFKGTILTDDQMKTNLDDVYAAGDCVMVKNRLTGKRQWSPMGSSANLEGRTLAQVLAGAQKSYPGVLGTGVVKLPGLNAGRTGLTEAQAKEAGYDVVTALVPTDDKAHYYPDASFFITKLIADRSTRKLLGVQVFGPGSVDKMVDIAVMGLNMGAVLDDFENAGFRICTAVLNSNPSVCAGCLCIDEQTGRYDRQHDSCGVCRRKSRRLYGCRCCAGAVDQRSGICKLRSCKRRNQRTWKRGETASCLCKGQKRIFSSKPVASLRLYEYSRS